MSHKFLSIVELQREIDVGWKEYCDDKIRHWSKQLSSCHAYDSKSLCRKQIKHFRVLKRMR